MTQPPDAAFFQRIDRAFREGNLDALREAVGHPALVPNGPLPESVGSCLTYAIYHSPTAFVTRLLEIGADPNGPAADGFPPLIAALTLTRAVRGVPPRSPLDIDPVVRALLDHGADANVRGVNDYTPLHMAVAEQNQLAVQRLLDAGADATLCTRIDERETALDMAERAGFEEIAAVLRRRGQPAGRRLRSGVTLEWDVPGGGPAVFRQRRYRVRMRTWVAGGAAVRWEFTAGPVGIAALEDDRRTLVTDIVVNRGRLISGVFYGLDGMRVGGTRYLSLAPQMAYGDRGVPDRIPPHASLVVEISVLAALDASNVPGAPDAPDASNPPNTPGALEAPSARDDT